MYINFEQICNKKIIPEIFLVREGVPKVVIIIRHEELVPSGVDYHLGHSEAVKIRCSRGRG